MKLGIEDIHHTGKIFSQRVLHFNGYLTHVSTCVRYWVITHNFPDFSRWIPINNRMQINFIYQRNQGRHELLEIGAQTHYPVRAAIKAMNHGIHLLGLSSANLKDVYHVFILRSIYQHCQDRDFFNTWWQLPWCIPIWFWSNLHLHQERSHLSFFSTLLQIEVQQHNI